MTGSTIATISAAIFALLAAYVFVFQCIVAAGAPWGHLTMGGRWPGKLPPAIRPLSVVQGLLALAMAAAVLDRAGLVALGWPDWTYYASLALCALTVLGNAATPSAPERRLGLPVAILMLLTALAAGFL